MKWSKDSDDKFVPVSFLMFLGYRIWTNEHIILFPPEICSGGCVNRCENHRDCPPGMNCYTDHTCRIPPERCSGEACCKPCETHADCTSGQSCYSDRACRDPCIYSMRCGKAALCRNVEKQPECYCPPGFVGDPAKECLSIGWYIYIIMITNCIQNWW